MNVFQENYTTPVEQTPVRQSPLPTMKGIPKNSLLVKVARGVFQRCVETTLDVFYDLSTNKIQYREVFSGNLVWCYPQSFFTRVSGW